MKLSYDLHGAGDTAIVLLHGFLENKGIWSFLTKKILQNESLLADNKVIAIDLPGHGASEPFEQQPQMRTYGEVIWKLLEQLEINYAILIGHSMGGYVACEMAAQKPARVKGFCLYHSTSYPDSEERKDLRTKALELIERDCAKFITLTMGKLFSDKNKEKFPEQIEALKQKALGTSQTGVAHATLAMRNRESATNFLMLTTFYKALFIGKYDPVTSMELSMEEVKLMKPNQYYFSEKASHMGYIESPEESLEFLEDFIQSSIAG